MRSKLKKRRFEKKQPRLKVKNCNKFEDVIDTLTIAVDIVNDLKIVTKDAKLIVNKIKSQKEFNSLLSTVERLGKEIRLLMEILAIRKNSKGSLKKKLEEITIGIYEINNDYVVLNAKLTNRLKMFRKRRTKQKQRMSLINNTTSSNIEFSTHPKFENNINYLDTDIDISFLYDNENIEIIDLGNIDENYYSNLSPIFLKEIYDSQETILDLTIKDSFTKESFNSYAKMFANLKEIQNFQENEFSNSITLPNNFWDDSCSDIIKYFNV